MNTKTSISVLHFHLSDVTRDQIHQIARPLFTHDCYVGHVEVIVEGIYTNNTKILYSVTVRAQLRGKVLFETEQDEQVVPAVESATTALNRRLAELSSAKA